MGFHYLMKKNRSLMVCFITYMFSVVIYTSVMLSQKKASRNTKNDESRDAPVTDQASNTITKSDWERAEFMEPSGDYRNLVPYLFNKNLKPSYILGNGTSWKASIVIGIPSVKRSTASYLFKTLHSLFHDMYPGNEERVCVVVFLAEEDRDFVESTGKRIYKEFTRQVDKGLLQVIAPDASLYPDFSKLPTTLGDLPDRWKWRSKAVYDVAYLMLFCVNKADYYLMLEDDVIASKGYAEAALNFTTKHEKEDFIYLALAKFNVIGKLFKMGDVPTWATYFFTFFTYKPVDWLMNDYVQLVSCYPGLSADDCKEAKHKKIPHLHPGIFQHIGYLSSLGGKWQVLSDSEFSQKHASFNPYENPAAIVKSSFEAVEHDSVQAWYDDSGGLRAHYNVKPASTNQQLTINFKEMQKITLILVKSGNDEKEGRITSYSVLLEYKYETLDYEQCAVFDHNGEAECHFIDQPIESIRIRLLKDVSSNIWFDSIFIN